MIQRLVQASGLDAVTLGVILTGTEKVARTNLGITTVEQGFDVLKSGARRCIDVGTWGELKEQFGSLALVIAGVQEVMRFDGLNIELSAVPKGKEIT